MKPQAQTAGEVYEDCKDEGCTSANAYDYTRQAAIKAGGIVTASSNDHAHGGNWSEYPTLIIGFEDGSQLKLMYGGCLWSERQRWQHAQGGPMNTAAQLHETYRTKRDQGHTGLAAYHYTRAAAIDAGGQTIAAADDCEVFAFGDGSELYISPRSAGYAPRGSAAHQQPETRPMKTRAVMLPAHGDEDQQVATLTELDNGGILIEAYSIKHCHNMASAQAHIKERWPWAYITEPVRDDTPPPQGSEPRLGDILNAAHHCTRNGMRVTCNYNPSHAELEIIILDGVGLLHVSADAGPDDITNAVLWLNQHRHRHTN